MNIKLTEQEIKDLKFLLLLADFHLGGTERAIRQSNFIDNLIKRLDKGVSE